MFIGKLETHSVYFRSYELNGRAFDVRFSVGAKIFLLFQVSKKARGPNNLTLQWASEFLVKAKEIGV
jgi:hypothetical protein